MQITNKNIAGLVLMALQNFENVDACRATSPHTIICNNLGHTLMESAMGVRRA